MYVDASLHTRVSEKSKQFTMPSIISKHTASRNRAKIIRCAKYLKHSKNLIYREFAEVWVHKSKFLCTISRHESAVQNSSLIKAHHFLPQETLVAGVVSVNLSSIETTKHRADQRETTVEERADVNRLTAQCRYARGSTNRERPATLSLTRHMARKLSGLSS